jgi:hypothetical protein
VKGALQSRRNTRPLSPRVADQPICVLPTAVLEQRPLRVDLPGGLSRAAGFPHLYVHASKGVGCTQWCGCKCHRLLRFSTPDVLDRLIGGWLFSLSGIWRAPCTQKLCERYESAGAMISWFLPSWSARRVLRFRLTIPQTGDLSCAISMLAIVPMNAPIWRAVRTGHIRGMIDLFDGRAASLTDVDEIGRSLLHVSLEKRVYGRTC